MKTQILILFFTVLSVFPVFSQEKYSFNQFLSYFPALQLPVSSIDISFEQVCNIKELDTNYVKRFINSGKIKYYEVGQDQETGEVTFEGWFYYDYVPIGKILFDNSLWVIYSFFGENEDEADYRYLVSYDYQGNKLDSLLIKYGIRDSVYCRYILCKNQDVKLFYYQSYNGQVYTTQIIVKTYKTNKENKFYLYASDSTTIIKGHTFFDFILDKLPGDPYYAELEKQKRSNP